MNFRLVLTLFLGLSYGLAAAQSYTPEPERFTKDACAKYTKELITSFQLNENEYIKLKNLNLQYISKFAQTNTYASLSAIDSAPSIHDLEVQYEQDLLSFLTPFQKQAYREFKKNNNSVLLHLAVIASANGQSKELLANRIAP